MTAKRDLSCRTFADYVRVLREQGVSPEQLCDGLDVTVADLENPKQWLDWETGAELLHRFGTLVDDDNPWRVLAQASVFRPSGWTIARLALGPVQLYRLLILYVATSASPIHTATLEHRDNQLHVDLRLPTDRVGSPSFFACALEVYIVAPRVLGLDDAEVTAQITPHHASYVITLPRSMTLLARARRTLGLMFRADDALTELIEQQDALRRSHAALEAAHDEMQHRQKDLMAEVEERRRTEQLLRETDEQLQHAQKLEVVGQLAGGIAHDFNNILMAVLCCAELLKDHVHDNGEALEMLADLEDATTRATLLTSQLLGFSRREHVRPQNVDPAGLIHAQMGVLARLVSGLTLESEIPDDLGTVLIDPTQLQQVVLNLVVNARDAVSDGGHILVRAALSADRVWFELSVEDDGTGIPAEVADRIFEPFFTTKGDGGTGLGLATVHGIVGDAGGTISVDSSPTGGARFLVRLPTVDRPADPLIPPRAARTEGGGNETLLLIEDDPVLRRVLFSNLDRAGYRTFTASSTADAKRVLDGLRDVDMVVSDFMLKSDRGTEVIDVVRARHPAAKAIVMSGFVDAEHDGKIREHPFLRKPFAPSVLLDLVRQVLDDPSEPLG